MGFIDWVGVGLVVVAAMFYATALFPQSRFTRRWYGRKWAEAFAPEQRRRTKRQTLGLALTYAWMGVCTVGNHRIDFSSWPLPRTGWGWLITYTLLPLSIPLLGLIPLWWGYRTVPK